MEHIQFNNNISAENCGKTGPESYKRIPPVEDTSTERMANNNDNPSTSSTSRPSQNNDGLVLDLLECQAVKDILQTIGITDTEIVDADLLDFILEFITSNDVTNLGQVETSQPPPEEHSGSTANAGAAIVEEHAVASSIANPSGNSNFRSLLSNWENRPNNIIQPMPRPQRVNSSAQNVTQTLADGERFNDQENGVPHPATSLRFIEELNSALPTSEESNNFISSTSESLFMPSHINNNERSQINVFDISERLMIDLQDERFREFLTMQGIQERQLLDPELVSTVYELIDLNGGMEALGLETNHSVSSSVDEVHPMSSNTDNDPTVLSSSTVEQPVADVGSSEVISDQVPSSEDVNRFGNELQQSTTFQELLVQAGITENQLLDPNIVSLISKVIQLTKVKSNLGQGRNLDPTVGDIPVESSDSNILPTSQNDSLSSQEYDSIRLANDLQDNNAFKELLVQVGITEDQLEDPEVVARVYELIDLNGAMEALGIESSNDSTENRVAPPSAPPIEIDDDSCVICSDAERKFAAVPCGHRSFCEDCCKLLKENSSLCPICREEVELYIKIII